MGFTSVMIEVNSTIIRSALKFASLHPADASFSDQSANEKSKFLHLERRYHIRAFHFSWWWLCFRWVCLFLVS